MDVRASVDRIPKKNVCQLFVGLKGRRDQGLCESLEIAVEGLSGAAELPQFLRDYSSDGGDPKERWFVILIDRDEGLAIKSAIERVLVV